MMITAHIDVVALLLSLIVGAVFIPPVVFWQNIRTAPKPPTNLHRGTADEWPLSDI